MLDAERRALDRVPLAFISRSSCVSQWSCRLAVPWRRPPTQATFLQVGSTEPLLTHSPSQRINGLYSGGSRSEVSVYYRNLVVSGVTPIWTVRLDYELWFYANIIRKSWAAVSCSTISAKSSKVEAGREKLSRLPSDQHRVAFWKGFGSWSNLTLQLSDNEVFTATFKMLNAFSSFLPLPGWTEFAFFFFFTSWRPCCVSVSSAPLPT